MLLSVLGFASSKTVQVRIYNYTTSTEVVAWTSTSVIERANGQGFSTYYYDYAVVSGNEYIIDWKDNSTPVNTAGETLNKMQTWVDASLSSIKAKTDQLNYTTINGVTSVKADQQYTVYSVVSDAGNSSGQFKTNMTFSNDGAAQGGWVEFITGSLTNMGPRRIATYVGSTNIIVLVSAFPLTPSPGDTFLFINK